MLSFAVKVLSLLPQSCPLEFKQAAEKWMDDMCSEKVEVWWCWMLSVVAFDKNGLKDYYYKQSVVLAQSAYQSDIFTFD